MKKFINFCIVVVLLVAFHQSLQVTAMFEIMYAGIQRTSIMMPKAQFIWFHGAYDFNHPLWRGIITTAAYYLPRDEYNKCLKKGLESGLYLDWNQRCFDYKEQSLDLKYCSLDYEKYGVKPSIMSYTQSYWVGYNLNFVYDAETEQLFVTWLQD